MGLFMSGALLGPLLIPNVSEMILATKLAYPSNDLDHANSLLSGMFQCIVGIG